MPPVYKENGFDKNIFDRFEGFLYDKNLRTSSEEERQIQALFTSMLENPNKIKYIDMRILNYDKEGRFSHGERGIGVDYNNEDYKFYRVTYTNKIDTCKEKTNKFIKLLPNHFRYLDNRIRKAIFTDKTFCFSVREIASNKASSFEFMPRKPFTYKDYMYFPPFFHTKSWKFPFISPTNRKKYNISDYQDVDQVYIYSHFNGIAPGTFIDNWGWALPGSSDLGLINRFLDDYVDEN